MRSQSIGAYRVSLMQNRWLTYGISLLLCVGILYYAYAFHIRQNLNQIAVIRNNIAMVNHEKLKEEIAEYRTLKKTKQEAYRTLLKQSKVDIGGLYTDKYSVAVDILGQVNRSFFNLYRYDLNRDYDDLKLQFNGSYINLIKFFDYLQTVKANIAIKSYKIELRDGKMLMSVNLTIGLIKI